jgi:agmatinase
MRELGENKTMNQIPLLSQMLCPPGEGVFTVHTAKQLREQVQKKIYSSENIREQWLKSLQEIPQREVIVLGVCSDAGGGIQRGANWGPLYIRQTYLDQNPRPDYLDVGDVRVIPHLLHDKYLNQETLSECREFLYNENTSSLPVSPLSLTEKICDIIYSLNPKTKIVGLGGDHSVSYPLVKSWLHSRHQNQQKKVGILHFDAHTDLLDKRMGVDLNFGSWAYHILKQLPSPNQLVQIGIRSTGKERSHWESLGLKQYWAHECMNERLHDVAQEIIQLWQQMGIEEVYITVDVDVLDEDYMSTTGTPEAQGLNPSQVVSFIQYISQHFSISSCDLVELAPHVSYKPLIAHNQFSSLYSSFLIFEALLNGTHTQRQLRAPRPISQP